MAEAARQEAEEYYQPLDEFRWHDLAGNKVSHPLKRPVS
jgi:hypothetical protein